MSDGTDPTELRLLAEAVAREVGALLKDGLDRVRLEVDTKSTGTDMVTEMDRAAEALIVQLILTARPDDGLLGEEGTDITGTSGVRWIVDPLDGTTNYLYALPGFNVSIAAEVDGTVVAGAVFDVIRDEMFAATLGGGATRDGARIHVSDATALPLALVATGFGYDAERRRRQAEVLVRGPPPHPRHAPVRGGGGRPVLGRRRSGRRLLRARPGALGPRGGRSDRGRGRRGRHRLRRRPLGGRPTSSPPLPASLRPSWPFSTVPAHATSDRTG